MGEIAESMRTSLEEARKVEISKFEEEAEKIVEEMKAKADEFVFPDINGLYEKIGSNFEGDFFQNYKFLKDIGLSYAEIEIELRRIAYDISLSPILKIFNQDTK